MQSDRSEWISSLALDTDNKKIYWADIGREMIEYCNYDGSSRKILRHILGAVFLSITMSKVCISTSTKY